MAFLTGYTKRRTAYWVKDGSVQANYQIQIVPHKSSDTDSGKDVYFGSNVQDDFDDFRVTKAEDSATPDVLDQWRESFNSGTDAIYWAEIHKVGSSLLSGNAASGQKVVDVDDGTVFAAGDFVIICDDTTPKGEVCEIDSISTNELTMVANLGNAYTTADNAKVCHCAYLYHNNGSATLKSVGADTFLFFDHFTGDSLDTDKWDTVGTPTIAVGSSIIDITPDAVSEYIKSKVYTVNQDVAIRTRSRDYKTDCVYPGAFGFGTASAPVATNCLLKIMYSGDQFCIYCSNSSDEDYSSPVADDDSYHIWDLTWLSAICRLNRDGIEQGTVASYIPSASLPVTVGNPYNQYANTIKISTDWIAVRNHVESVPAWGTWGDVETWEEISAAVIVGVLATATRLKEAPRSAAVVVGVVASATREIVAERTAAVITGIVATATRVANFFESAAVIVGLAVDRDLTTDKQVAVDNDDCRRDTGSSPYFSLSDEHQIAGGDNSFDEVGGGMRFTNVAIPKGATITNAYLTLRCNASKAGTIVNTRISAEDVDDAPTFSTVGNYDSRFANHTTARIDWDSIPAWTAGVDYNSPDIKTVIQEVIDRAGWASGNDIVIFWEDYDDRSSHNDDAHRPGYSRDSSATYAPKLHIEYTTPGALRSTEIIRNAVVQVGKVASATRELIIERISSVVVGIVASATKVGENIVQAAVQIGLVASASRVTEISIAAATSIGLVATAVGYRGAKILAAVTIGVVATASRTLDITRTASVVVGKVVTATGFKGAAITAAVIVGVVATASRTLDMTRLASTIVGKVVTAAITEVLLIGRSLLIRVTTSPYRSIVVATSQYRLVRVATALYRKIKVFTLGR